MQQVHQSVGHRPIAQVETIQSQAFQTSSPFVSSLDYQLAGTAYDIEINKLYLPEPGRGIYHSDSHCFLEYVLQPEHDLKGAYPKRIDQRPAGQLVFIPPGATLEWRWASGCQHTITCMFDPSRLGVLGAYPWEWGHVDLSSTLDIRSDYLVMGMRKLGEEARAPGFASELQIESTLTLMAFELRKQFMANRRCISPVTGRLSETQLRRVRDYVHGHLGSELNHLDIARACEINPRALSELFRNTIGVTLRHYIANARVMRARGLLANRELLIKQVGYDCGFRGAAAFGAAFRKATGMTPTEYRQRFCS